MVEINAHYLLVKIRGQPERREVYLLDGSPKKIELSPHYDVSSCNAAVVHQVYSDWHFKEVKLPSDLLEEIIRDIEKSKKTDTIFDPNPDLSLRPRIEKNAIKIVTIIGRQLGYPYSKGKQAERA